MLQALILVLVLWPQEPEKPLPDPSSFMAEFRKTLHTDGKLLRQYTYTQKETEITLDSKGKPTKTETNVYHVVQGEEDWQTYRKHISKNGKELSEKDAEKQDREERERIDKERKRRENRSEAKKQEEKTKEDREERETIDDVFQMFDFKFIRREAIDGRSAIMMTYTPKAGYKPKTDDGKLMHHLAGRAWIDEDDHEVAKLEAEIIDPISLGAGLLAKLRKGSTLTFERRKINGEIWLPVREEILLNGRLLLLKGINLHGIVEYSDHKKYNVDTILQFGDPR
jgi:hypothetical protein